MDFGKVKMLVPKQLVVEVRNPSKQSALVTLERFPNQRGFALVDHSSTPSGLWEQPGSAASIPSQESLTFCLEWTPNVVGAVTDVLELGLTHTLSQRVRLPVTLKGFALESEGPLKKRITKQPAKSLNLKKPALAGGLLSRAEDALGPRAASSLSASTSTAVTSRGLANEGFRYRTQDAWYERQERAFTSWVNHLIVPEELAGTRTFSRTERGMRARVTGMLGALYRRDPGVREALMRVEELVDKGQLALDPDRSAVTDVSLQDRALHVFQELSPMWLQLVLEVVAGRTVLQGDV